MPASTSATKSTLIADYLSLIADSRFSNGSQMANVVPCLPWNQLDRSPMIFYNPFGDGKPPAKTGGILDRITIY